MTAKSNRSIKEVTRSFVETIAEIMGPSSACAQALKQAKEHNGPVKFYMTKGSVIVEKLPKER